MEYTGSCSHNQSKPVTTHDSSTNSPEDVHPAATMQLAHSIHFRIRKPKTKGEKKRRKNHNKEITKRSGPRALIHREIQLLVRSQFHPNSNNSRRTLFQRCGGRVGSDSALQSFDFRNLCDAPRRASQSGQNPAGFPTFWPSDQGSSM